MRVLITGTAGFIGFHLARRLLAQGWTVTGVDNFSAYYDVALKERRNALLEAHDGYAVRRLSLEDSEALAHAYEAAEPEVVVHLAAQAGVRYSIEHPETYVASNLVGTFNLLQLARLHRPGHFLAASTSSAYGANTVMPFRETDAVPHPLTLYAATKIATESMGHSYSHLFDLPMTFFRFFTVYGPWGRPDMALFKFTKAILEGRPIDVYNHGVMNRDFTYVDDLVEAVARLIGAVPGKEPVAHDSLSPVAPFRVVNIGRGEPTSLLAFIEEIEKAVGRESQRNYMPMQPGDVPSTFAAADLLETLTGYRPTTSIAEGVSAFVRWYLDHYAPGEAAGAQVLAGSR